MGWIALVVLVTAGWPGRAHASCGDYVTMQAHHDSAAQQVQPTTRPPLAVPSSPPPGQPVPVPRPTCRDVQCMPPAAPLTSAKPTSPRDDLRVFVVGDTAEAAVGSPTAPLFFQEFARAAGYPSSIYHPPR